MVETVLIPGAALVTLLAYAVYFLAMVAVAASLRRRSADQENHE